MHFFKSLAVRVSIPRTPLLLKAVARSYHLWRRLARKHVATCGTSIVRMDSRNFRRSKKAALMLFPSLGRCYQTISSLASLSLSLLATTVHLPHVSSFERGESPREVGKLSFKSTKRPAGVMHEENPRHTQLTELLLEGWCTVISLFKTPANGEITNDIEGFFIVFPWRLVDWMATIFWEATMYCLLYKLRLIWVQARTVEYIGIYWQRLIARDRSSWGLYRQHLYIYTLIYMV